MGRALAVADAAQSLVARSVLGRRWARAVAVHPVSATTSLTPPLPRTRKLSFRRFFLRTAVPDLPLGRLHVSVDGVLALVVGDGGGGSPDLRIIISIWCFDLADCDFYLRGMVTTSTHLHVIWIRLSADLGIIQSMINTMLVSATVKNLPWIRLEGEN